VSALANKLPVNLPDTTPLRSDAALQLLALAVESATNKPFEETFNDNIAAPIGLENTHFLRLNSQLFGSGISNTSLAGEQASLGLTSTISDLAKLGRSILTSAILPPATTRRWLKPFASTSNLRNAVGRPWEIYHYSANPTDAVIDVYTKSGTVDKYSSYFGLVPSYDVGFAILAVDSGRGAPDLNAYADVTLGEYRYPVTVLFFVFVLLMTLLLYRRPAPNRQIGPNPSQRYHRRYIYRRQQQHTRHRPSDSGSWPRYRSVESQRHRLVGADRTASRDRACF